MPGTRYWPKWNYTLPEELMAVMDEYHILKVPLLGQHNPGGEKNWCGRTSCSMAYNYYQVVQSGGDEAEFRPKLITHWNADKEGHYVDLRYPGGQRAFHTLPTEPPYGHNLSGYAVSDASYTGGDVEVVQPPAEFRSGGQYNASRILGFSYKKLLDSTVPNRRAEATRIANDPALLLKQMESVLDALSFNNPVVFYSGFSMAQEEPIHLILFIGYAYLKDDSGRHLWLVVADPATLRSKIDAGMFHPPNPNQEHDLKGLTQLSSKHDLIRVFPGNWENADAALVLIRARKLFEENTWSTVRDDLYMDYMSKESQTHKGGAHIYSHKATPVPPAFVFTNVARSVSYPFDSPKERLRPVNYYALTERAPAGRFPVGSLRNLHSGVHLEVSSFAKPAPPPPPPPKPSKGQTTKGQATTPSPPQEQKTGEQASRETPQTASKGIRCLAPGYIVAIRLVNAYPSKKVDAGTQQGAGAKPGQGKEAKKGPTPHELSRELAGNHNSFVLVRHDVEEALPKGEGGAQDKKKGKRFTFYSLYMHLAPPDWKDPNTYRDVVWHKTLARRNGCLAVLDPQHESFRQVRWLNELPPGVTGLTDESELVTLRGGTFSTIGAGVGTPQPVALGEAMGDLIRGVWKKPEQDLEEIHQALEEGKTVTFSRPYLEVEAGELIGYIDERNDALGDGFVHWEILAPSEPGQLKAFLEFAEEKLGLAGSDGGFFKFFQEKDAQNNYFDPLASSDGGDLASLLDLAPVSRHAREREKEDLKGFRVSYDSELLRNLLESTWALPFSQDDQPSTEPGYVTKVLIENYKNCLPQGPYKLKFTFEPDCGVVWVDYDGCTSSVDIVLPARARKIFVEPVLEPAGKVKDFFVQTGNDSGKDGLQKDVEHFKKLASVRWRNVVLRHLNDWSVKGITAQLQARLEAEGMVSLGATDLFAENKNEAKKAIEDYAKSVAWWAHNENAFLGSEREKKLLFGDGGGSEDGGETQLPTDTPLDNPHPVTFAWLLMLVTRHGFVRFADLPPWRSDEMKKVEALGWLPAQTVHAPRRIGESVQVAVVQRGNGDESLAVGMKLGGLSLEIARGSFKEGMFTESVQVPGWGQLALEQPEGAVALGTLELQGLTPSLLWAREQHGQDGTQVGETTEVPVPVVRKGKGKSKSKDADGMLSWSIPFRENCPKLLRGWILIRYWSGRDDEAVPKDVSSFQIAKLAIPIEAREDMSLETAGFAIADGYIRKGNIKDASTYVSQHFTYKAFLDAAKGQPAAAGSEPLLAWELAEAVERIQCAYSPMVPLPLAALAADGLSLQLKAPTKNMEALRKALEKVKADGWLADFQDDGKGTFRISVNAPRQGNHPGELVIEFNPSTAFAEFRKNLAPGRKIAVMFGCFFPNGGGALDGRLLPSEAIATQHVPLNGAEQLKSAAREGYLELWSTSLAQVLRRPGFDKPVVTLTEKGAQVSVRLLGAPESFWRAVEPVIKFGRSSLDTKDLMKVRFRSENESLCLVRSLNLGDPQVKGMTLVLSAEARKKGVLLEGEKIDVENSERLKYEVKPKAALKVARDGGAYKLVITVKTEYVPISRGFKVEIVRPPEPVKESPPVAPVKKPGAAGKKAAPAEKKPEAQVLRLPKDGIVYTSRAAKERVVYGLTNAEGIFTASLDESAIAAELKNGIEYTLRVVPVFPSDTTLTCEEKRTLHEELQPEPEDKKSPDVLPNEGER